MRFFDISLFGANDSVRTTTSLFFCTGVAMLQLPAISDMVASVSDIGLVMSKSPSRSIAISFWTWYVFRFIQTDVTVMQFWVRVPVLSLAITLTLPRVSIELRD